MRMLNEVKRKVFHHLSLVYLLLYAILPRWVTLLLMGIAVVGVGIFEFLRLRRPEVNAWILGKFSGIHREHEVLEPSGVVWTLLGCWMTMLIFVDRLIGVAGIGVLVFGDTAAALVGRSMGRHRLKSNPEKSVEGSVAFAVTTFLWCLLLVRPHAALVCALFTTWIESMKWKSNDNFWIPLAASFAISISFGGKIIRGNPFLYLSGRTILFTVLFAAASYIFLRIRKKTDETIA